MKWFLRLFKRRVRTPLPPKPYVDTASTGKHMVDPRLYDMEDLKHIDPEKPHWQDARFESREKVPFFDFFGYNRDWSWTLFKLSTVIFVLVFYMELRTAVYMKNDPPKVSSTTTVSAVPEYARDEKATEEELREAGFAYIGVKKLDNLGNVDVSAGSPLSTGLLSCILDLSITPTITAHSEESYGGKYKTEGMNEIYARRLAQTMTFHQLMRSHGTLWAATQVTKEKLDLSFVKEELMRVNGRRAMPLLIGAAAEENLNDAHLVHLTEHCAWAESARAFAVQRQTPLTQHIAAMGRMSETINQSKAASSVQTLFNEHLSRIEGIATFEEEPVFEEENFN